MAQRHIHYNRPSSFHIHKPLLRLPIPVPISFTNSPLHLPQSPTPDVAIPPVGQRGGQPPARSDLLHMGLEIVIDQRRDDGGEGCVGWTVLADFAAEMGIPSVTPCVGHGFAEGLKRSRRAEEGRWRRGEGYRGYNGGREGDEGGEGRECKEGGGRRQNA